MLGAHITILDILLKEEEPLMKCNTCGAAIEGKQVGYQLIDGEIITLECNACFANKLLDLVSNNPRIGFTQDVSLTLDDNTITIHVTTSI
jgi:hypothetical protein